MRALTIPEAAYHAGIMDGEGTICIKDKKGRGRNWYVPGISVVNTDHVLLSYLRTNAETGSISPMSKDVPHRKDSWQWNLWTSDFVPYLKTIVPYLITKKDRALLMLEFLQYHRTNSRQHPYSEHELMMRQVIFEEMTELNKRGK